MANFANEMRGISRPVSLLAAAVRLITGLSPIFLDMRAINASSSSRGERRTACCWTVSPRCRDLRQTRELASLICASDEAVDTFIAHCDVAARDLLRPFGDVVMALSTVLRIIGHLVALRSMT